MESGYDMPPRRQTKSRSTRWLIFLLCISLIALMSILTWLTYNAIKERPSTEWAEPGFAGLDKPVFIGGRMLELEAEGADTSLSMPLELLQKEIDSSIWFEEASESVVLTTADQVIRMKTDQLTAELNGEPLTLHFPVQRVEEQIYVPVAPLLEIYDLQIVETTSGAVLLRRGGDQIQWVEVLEPVEPQEEGEEVHTVAVRQQADIHSPILHELAVGEQAALLAETAEGWYHVQWSEGFTGYVEKQDMRLASLEIVQERERSTAYIPWKPLGGKINLTWEAVYGRNPDTNTIPDMPGLNVVSPTWFSLKKASNGSIYVDNIADAGYVRWAHERGYQVWGLFSNDFDPDLTTEALADYDTRKSIIHELLGFAELYNLQGINIDFENVYLKDQANLTQFVRELTPYMHEQDLVVSIDVTIRGGSEMWSLFADRRALGEVVDYMMVMTYDQHWRTSPEAGSVAELPWVEKGITDIIELDDVPAHKLVLGVPYYTYQWFEELDAEGQVTKVTSKTLFMDDVQDIIVEKGLTPVFQEEVGQHYVEYEENGQRVKIWIEDAASMQRRAELVKKLDLAGIASWRRGFETPDIWETIKDTLEQRP